MFDFDAEAAKMVGVCFDTMGTPATHFDGVSVTTENLKAQIDAPDVEFGAEHARMNLADAVIRVAKAALPAQPKRDSYFTLAKSPASRYYVLEDARIDDADRLVWACAVEERPV